MVGPTKKSSLFHRNIVLWFSRDLIPFHEIGLDGISDFLAKYKVITARNDLPHPTTLARQALTDVYDATKAVVVQMLTQSPTHGSLTIDMWTDSHSHHKYLGLTYHYVDQNWELINVTLRVASLPVSHTAENINAEIKKTLRMFGLLEKKITILRDNGANVIRACFVGKFTSYGCVGHGLHNLVVKDGIDKVERVGLLLTKCLVIVRSLVYKSEELLQIGDEELRKNLEQVAELEAILVADSNLEVESGDVPNLQHPTTLKRDEPTRWSSILEMFQSLLRNRAAVSRMLVMVGRADSDLDDQDYDLIVELIKFLKLFKTTTEYLSGSKYPTSNLALLLRSEISSALVPSATDSQIVRSLKFFMRKNLDKRFPVTDHLIVAALLDPRLQSLNEIDSYLNENHTDKSAFLKKQASGFVPTNLQPGSGNPDVEIVQPAAKQVRLNELIKKHSSNRGPTISLELEVSSLLAPGHDENDDVLAFWKKNRVNFPTLSKLAAAVFGIPATSVPCERLFSIAGLVVTSKRASLCPFTVDRLVFVHDNYQYGKKFVNNLAD